MYRSSWSPGLSSQAFNPLWKTTGGLTLLEARHVFGMNYDYSPDNSRSIASKVLANISRSRSAAK